MMTGSEGDAILRDILEHPEDDTPRLVYADWLEENGQEERGRFIRDRAGSRPREPYQMPCNHLLMGRREIELIFFDQVTLPAAGNPLAGIYMKEREGYDYSASRGFIDHIEMPHDAFLAHAELLFRHHPITSVRLTDRKLTHISEEALGWPSAPRSSFMVGWLFRSDGVILENHIANLIAQHLHREAIHDLGLCALCAAYRSDTAAHLNLDHACVAYGCKLAGINRDQHD